MLLDSRERGREALVNRAANAAARPAPLFPMLPRLLFGEGGGLFQPPAPDPPRNEPPRPVAQPLGFNDGGDFDWIDNPRTYIRLTVSFAILIHF